MKGRKAITNELKKLRGTDQPVRMKNEVSADLIMEPIVSIPKGSALKSKRSKKIFMDKANQLIALRVLTEFDLEQLSIYAFSLDQVFICMERIVAEGYYRDVITDKGITTLVNPCLKIYKEMVDVTNRIGSEFGFTPVSRQKINAKEPEEKNPFADLLNNL